MKKLTLISILSLVLTSSAALAHDEGHGPKLTDAGKQGGVVAAAIHAEDAKKGKHATMVHKAELVRSEDGTVRVYFYTQDMGNLDPTKLDAEANGILEAKKGKKWVKTPFTLKLQDGAYVGKPPKPSSRPFNIDVRVKEAGKELLAAFDNLD